MAEKSRKTDRSKAKKPADQSNKIGKSKNSQKHKSPTSALSLLASEQTVDPALSSLFAIQQPPIEPKPVARPISASQPQSRTSDVLSDVEPDESESVQPKKELWQEALSLGIEGNDDTTSRRKRKRKDADVDVEDAYMHRLAREEVKEVERLESERNAKKQKVVEQNDSAVDGDQPAEEATPQDTVLSDDESLTLDPPKHETEAAADEELAKANRTVFLGNVSTSAIRSKSARKTLMAHLGSFFKALPASKDADKHKVESIRFRSTPYTSAMPKKASFVKQELMDATTKSTNAYVVYSSQPLAREAAKRLNGTTVLDRHLRVDEVAHPAKVDHRRCVFVGNLGFVDDESNIQQANEDEGRETRKRGKVPADVEEGLWRAFSSCGKVESVRVIRDSTTRVGKGVAYVQFEDENAVEAALLYNEKKFPPMLPRKLRVTRARAQKRNAKPASGRPGSKPSSNGYQRKITAEEASKMGRAGKLLGRAAAAQMRHPDVSHANKAQPEQRSLGEGIRKPETFVFEGHRASARQGKSGLKLGGKGGGKKKQGKARVTQRSKSFKTKQRAS